jgi:hypothetical protein
MVRRCLNDSTCHFRRHEQLGLSEGHTLLGGTRANRIALTDRELERPRLGQMNSA